MRQRLSQTGACHGADVHRKADHCGRRTAYASATAAGSVYPECHLFFRHRTDRLGANRGYGGCGICASGQRIPGRPDGAAECHRYPSELRCPLQPRCRKLSGSEKRHHHRRRRGSAVAGAFHAGYGVALFSRRTGAAGGNSHVSVPENCPLVRMLPESGAASDLSGYFRRCQAAGASAASQVSDNPPDQFRRKGGFERQPMQRLRQAKES